MKFYLVEYRYDDFECYPEQFFFIEENAKAFVEKKWKNQKDILLILKELGKIN